MVVFPVPGGPKNRSKFLSLLERNVVFRLGKIAAETILYRVCGWYGPTTNMPIFNANNFRRPFDIAEPLSNFVTPIFQELVALQEGF